MSRGGYSYHINFYDAPLKTPLLPARQHQAELNTLETEQLNENGWSWCWFHQ